MWRNPDEAVGLATLTEEIFNGKLHFFVQFYLKKVFNYKIDCLTCNLCKSEQHKPLGNNCINSFPREILAIYKRDLFFFNFVKSLETSKRFPDIPSRFKVKISTLWQFLRKVFNISRNTLLIPSLPRIILFCPP